MIDGSNMLGNQKIDSYKKVSGSNYQNENENTNKKEKYEEEEETIFFYSKEDVIICCHRKIRYRNNKFNLATK